MKLSFLDFVSIHRGETQKEAIDNSMATLRHAESLGLHRYWFTEHHSSKTLVSSAPDLMIALALSHVTKIRLGSGGIMLPNHSSLKVAENFSILESLYPGKIDLGLGRAAGTNPQTAWALARSSQIVSQNDFSSQVMELKHHFNHSFPLGHPYASIQLSGEKVFKPNMMMLGSSRGGLEFSLAHDLPFVFAGHISPDLMVSVLNEYHERSGKKGIAAIGVLCASSKEEAEYLLKPYLLKWLRFLQGQGDFTTPSFEEAEAYVYTENDLIIKEGILKKLIYGTPEFIEKELKLIEERCKVDEIMMVDVYPTHESRLEGLSLLAQKIDLS